MSTATTLPFFGGELSSFDPSGSGAIESASGAGSNYDAAFARCCIFMGPGYYANSPTWSGATTFWFHFRLNWGSGSNFTNARILSFYNGATEVFRMQGTGLTTTTWTFYTLQSAVLTSVGTFAIPPGFQTFDIKLVSNSLAGTFQFYSSGTLVLNVAGLDHSGFAGVTQVQPTGLGVPFNGGDAFWSEIICDSSSHIGDRLKTFPVDTNSAVNTGWTGSVTNVNEVVLNDATFAYAASATLTSTYYASGFSLGTYNIVAVGVSARANLQSAVGPQNLQLVLRSGGSNHNSSSIALANGYQACAHSWTTDPNGNIAWTAANAQVVEGGQESIA